uniref:Putative cytochrome C oxidase subunit VIa n=1 Tax=Knoxdaviesia capensis TaxID=114771 RepID=A0A1J0CYE4_9PEZI|nr:putative cytochrome C oxidase subunit VIa [Knoxdaviesia capensis]
MLNRVAVRGASRFAAQMRAPAARNFTTGEAFIKEREAVQHHAAETTGMLAGCIPVLILASANAYYLWNQHWEHWSHLPPLEERVEYPYQNIRTKNFPWGDGDKLTFDFWVCYRPRSLSVPASRAGVRVVSPFQHRQTQLTASSSPPHSWNDKVNYHNHDKTK